MIAHLQGREQALEPFGWTGRQAEWIALACLHSGVFTRAQLSAYLRIDRWQALRFVRAMSERRLAADETLEGRKVCRICGRGIYRALGAEDIRHRRTASDEVLLRRLLSLDYVLEHPGLPWLPTESEKVGAFEALGVERRILPSRLYRGAAGNTRRYFPLNCRSRWTPSAHSSSTSIPATIPRRRYARGAWHIAASGRPSGSGADPSRSWRSSAP